MAETSSDSGLSLPRGGGAIHGLGEKFEPDFHTGGGSFAIPLDLPNGPNDIAPRLTLLYSTSSGNGPFGLGFAIPLPAIARATETRIPAYTADDPLVLVGGGELVEVAPAEYRLRADAAAGHIVRGGDGFTLTAGDGRIHRLGISAAARVVDEMGRVLEWRLESMEDALGNIATFTHRRDGRQLYPDEIAYSVYRVRFTYEERPDPFSSGRGGFVVQTRLRCTAIELHETTAGAPQLVRRWTLAYDASDAHHSLLGKVTLTGFAADGATETLPPLELGYSPFAPRRLQRFGGETRGTQPAARGTGRRELLDWDGNGLPDLLEIETANVRVWRNRGDGTWARPESIRELPAPAIASAQSFALADMEGNGTADIVTSQGYYPHEPGGGFRRPVSWRGAPAELGEQNARLVDLDGDRVADLLVTHREFFVLYFRRGEEWSNPVTVPRGSAPPVSLADPHVRIADMNGDGLPDLVRVTGAGVTYWPYLGHARWGDAVVLGNAPELPLRFDPERMYLSDVDGDGCADLVYVDGTRVLYWLNESGVRMGERREIRHTPPASSGTVRLADMNGSGTAGVLWTGDSLYLDFCGGAKPYLLARVDNGLGRVTEAEFGSSASDARRDRDARRPWTTFLPFVVPVLRRLTVRDTVTGTVSTKRFRYREGHFDGVLREFCGFREVEIEELGDEFAPALLTRNVYHLGAIIPSSRNTTAAERRRLRALRGKLVSATESSPDGTAAGDRPYATTENRWNAVFTMADAAQLISVRLEETRTTAFERQPEPFRVVTMRNLLHDADGNVLEQEQIADDPRDAALRIALRTTTTYASDPARRFRGFPARTTQVDGTGNIVAATIRYYDGLAEGGAGARGLLTRQETLVLSDALVTAAYGAAPPDFAALGYHRRAGEDGWWIDEARYMRGTEASALSGSVVNPAGAVTAIRYDAHNIHPVSLTDARGNIMTASFEYRANKIASVTDANGVTIQNRYDPLGRTAVTIEPGASEALPTTTHAYRVDSLPASVEDARRAIDGDAAMIRRRVFYDGAGQVIQQRVAGGAGEIVERADAYCSRGLIARQWLPHPAPAATWQPPDVALPHRTFRYDALRRLVAIVRSDGASRRVRFAPGTATVTDEKGVVTSYELAPTGRIAAVALQHDGRTLRTQYEHDVKGNLTAVTETDGARTTLVYDLLGRRIRTTSPASGTTLAVHDAAGNLVQKSDARAAAVTYRYDELRRLQATIDASTGATLAESIYHDTAGAAPPEAGPFSRGRVVRTTDSGGGTAAFEYDALGRVIAKTMTGPGLPPAGLRLDFAVRADGQLASVTYPSTAPGGARLVVRYEYDARGALRRIPGFVRSVQYDGAGQRVRVEFGNDVVTSFDPDPETRKLAALTTISAAGTRLQDIRYTYDLVGNLVETESTDPRAACVFTYDDLHRLTQAVREDGRNWSYAYDDTGDLTSKSDIGAYVYDAQRRLVQAGPDALAYDDAGNVLTAPWGTAGYDAAGRMQRVTRGASRLDCTYDGASFRTRAIVTGAGGTLDDVLTPDARISIENGVAYGFVLDGEAFVTKIRLDDAAASWLHGDHLGSVAVVTAMDGEAVQRIDYDPFGAILANDLAGGSEGSRRLYAGAEWDVFPGLVHLQARYYDPRLGRFAAADTVVGEAYAPQAWNRYAYVQNNPLRFVDPTGHFWDEIGDFFEKNWKHIVAVVVIVAVIVLTIATFGVGGVLAGVIAGMVIGGIVGGVAAHQAGGDVLLGALVGMAAGGAAALGGAGIGAALSGLGHGIWATALVGGLKGAVVGSAMGFASGFAGGRGDASSIFDRMWRGALVGAATGFAFGLLQGSLADIRLRPPTGDELHKAAAETAKYAGEQGEVGTLTQTGLAGKAATELAGSFVHSGGSGFAPFTTEILTAASLAVPAAGGAIVMLGLTDEVLPFLKVSKKGTF